MKQIIIYPLTHNYLITANSNVLDELILNYNEQINKS